MNETVKEWVEKAEGDFRTAGREIAAIEQPNFDAVCYHSQQCIEKLIKALLIHHGVTPPRIHDLVHLDQLLSPVVTEWSWPVEELRFLTRAAVEFRYPGGSADQDEAREAFDLCTKMRDRLRSLLGA
jgi:HEPN domain-containing protein